MRVDATENFPSYKQILHLSWPIILANIATPFLGLVDTAVIGHTGSAAGLGAIAIGSLALNFIYWAFGFLRMSTTGFVAQAKGAGDTLEVRAATLRAVGAGLVLGVGIIVLQFPLARLSFSLMDATGEINTLGRGYFGIRIWAAPATLVTYAICGALIGLGRTRWLLALQIVLNVLNITLDVLLAGVLSFGVRGIAVGTLVSEWTAAVFGIWIMARLLGRERRDSAALIPWRVLWHAASLRATFSTQGNLMLRTLALLLGFAWFTRLGAQLGAVTLAANHVLLGLISFCAFFLDGFALPTENLVGSAWGRKDRGGFDRAVRRTTLLAAATSVGLALVLLALGNSFIAALTDLPKVRALANEFLPWAATYVALSFVAFQLDGVFVGSTQAKEMRNASLVSLVVFVGVSAWVTPIHGNSALWLSFIGYVVLRALTLGRYYPQVRRAMGRGLAPGSETPRLGV